MLNSTKTHRQLMSEPGSSGYRIRAVEHQRFVMENSSDSQGLPCKVLVRKTVKPLDEFKAFKVHDFSVQCLTAAGAVNLLKPVQLKQSLDGSLENVDRVLDFVDEAEQVLSNSNIQ